MRVNPAYGTNESPISGKTSRADSLIPAPSQSSREPVQGSGIVRAVDMEKAVCYHPDVISKAPQSRDAETHLVTGVSGLSAEQQNAASGDSILLDAVPYVRCRRRGAGLEPATANVSGPKIALSVNPTATPTVSNGNPNEPSGSPSSSIKLQSFPDRPNQLCCIPEGPTGISIFPGSCSSYRGPDSRLLPPDGFFHCMRTGSVRRVHTESFLQSYADGHNSINAFAVIVEES